MAEWLSTWSKPAVRTIGRPHEQHRLPGFRLAYRSISIATVEERLCWPAGKLERFLVGAITEVDRDEFRLKDLASLAHVLDFDIEICVMPRKQETTG